MTRRSEPLDQPPLRGHLCFQEGTVMRLTGPTDLFRERVSGDCIRVNKSCDCVCDAIHSFMFLECADRAKKRAAYLHGQRISELVGIRKQGAECTRCPARGVAAFEPSTKEFVKRREVLALQRLKRPDTGLEAFRP